MSQELQAYIPLVEAGKVADQAARLNRLTDYKKGLASQTLRKQEQDIALFQKFLASKRIEYPGDLFTDITAWQHITFGLLEMFREQQLLEGYALGSINGRIATLKKYARVARESDVISAEAFAMIALVSIIKKHQQKNFDENRPVTRIGRKKSRATPISYSHIAALRELLEADEGYRGRRDYFLICLLGRQGLRVGEVADLLTEHIDMATGDFVLYRRKVDRWQTHHMHPQTLLAAQRYFAVARPSLKVFQGISRPAYITQAGKAYRARDASEGLSTRGINAHVRKLGEMVGIERLSPHDLRHFWTKDMFKNNTPIDKIKESGGWKSYAMPDRYRGESAIANEGVIQTDW